MAVSLVPGLIDALIAAAESAGVANVLDGPGLSEDAAAGDYLMVGVDDPNSEDDSFAAEGRQKWAHANHTTRDEAGSITLAAYSWNGNGDQKAARDAVHAMAEVIVDAAVTLPDLGLANNLWVDPMADHRLTQSQGEFGAMALLIFTVDYQARF